MDPLRQKYDAQRKEYTITLKDALREGDPERMKVHVERLLNLNQQMSATVGEMMNLVAQTESKIDLTKLRTHLTDELVGIQKDVKKLHDSRGERKVLESIHAQYTSQAKREDATVYMYLIAIAVALVLLVFAVIKASFWTPALPPVATSALGLSGGPPLG